MKKILIVTSTSRGTISSCSFNLYKALSSVDDFEVFVYSTNQNNSFDYPYKNIYGCSSHTNKLIKLFYHVRNLRRIKRENNIDLAISTLTAFNAYNLLSTLGEKKIGIFHAPVKQTICEGVIKGLPLFVLSIITIFFSNLFFTELWAVSKEALVDINQFSIFKKKNNIVYNVHFNDDINMKSSESLTKELKDTKYFVFVGNLYNIKGWDRLLRAFSIFHKQNPEIKLVICGSFPTKPIEDQFNNLSSSLQINEYVVNMGFQPNPYHIIKNSLALLSCSYSESLPGVIIEALSLGIPVISTNSSAGVWEIFDCIDRYDKDLNEVKVFSEGIITPNKIAFTDSNILDTTSDDILFANAMSYLLFNPLFPSFRFEKKCDKDAIITPVMRIFN